MNIAELFVRVSGDTSDVTSKLRGAQRSMDEFGNSTKRASVAGEGHKLSLGKIERALASYVGHAVGANAVTEQLSTAFGSFALGGGVVAGALIGVGAVIAIYERLTESTRKAAEEQKKLTDALGAQFAPKTGPRSQTSKEFNAALQTRADLTKQLGVLQNNRDDPLVANSFIGRNIVDKQIEEVQQKLLEVNQSISDAMAGSITKLGTVTVSAGKNVDEVTGKYNELREAADKVNAGILSEKRDWWKGYIESTTDALSITQQLANRIQSMQPSLLDALQALSQVGQGAPSFSMPTISLDDGLTDEQKKTRDALLGNGDKNARIIASTIESMASVIVSSLNFGGGGRGSSIGSALGGAVGFGLGKFASQHVGKLVGTALGSVVPGVGTIVGSITGSLIGGLFDHHKKAVDSNTDALRANTAALLLNEPRGFKVAAARYDATDVKAMAAAVRRYGLRGGAPVFGTP